MMNKITCTILKRQEIKRILNKPHFTTKYAAWNKANVKNWILKTKKHSHGEKKDIVRK